MSQRVAACRLVMIGSMSLIAAAGCDGPEAEAPSGVTAAIGDSAGITITENEAPTEIPFLWTVDSVPELELGATEADQLYRVLGAFRRTDGSIVVANGGDQELLLFQPDGSLEARIGGEGDGPGEFRALAGVLRYRGDSLAAPQYSGRPLTLFDRNGVYARQLVLDLSGIDRPFPWAFVLGALPDGSWLTRLAEGFLAGTGLQGFQTTTAVFLHHGVDGRLADTVSVAPGPEQMVKSTAGAMSVAYSPFFRTTLACVSGGDIVMGHNAAWQYELRSPTGAVERIVRLTREPRPVDEQDRTAYTEYLRSVVEDPEDVAWRTEHFPTTMPTYSDLVCGDDRTVWLKPYVPPFESDTAPWLVFDREGRLLGQVQLPPLSLLQADSSHVLGTLEDELGVETIQVYRRGL